MNALNACSTKGGLRKKFAEVQGIGKEF